MNDFDSKTVLVTGAAAGIGKATTLMLAARGAHVVLLDKDDVAAKVVAQECDARGATATVVVTDITDSAAVDRTVTELEGSVGRIHSLVNVAGVYPGDVLVEMDDALWRTVLDVNLTGTMNMCRALARHMLARGGGSIVNVSSGGSHTPTTRMSAYAASKGGVEAFTRTIALELAPSVRVNVVAPGLTDTNDLKAEFTTLVDTVPLHRWAHPDEIAEPILFFASERASFITGQTLFVTGGRTMT